VTLAGLPPSVLLVVPTHVEIRFPSVAELELELDEPGLFEHPAITRHKIITAEMLITLDTFIIKPSRFIFT
jgi:hypothetical protein